MTTRFYFIAFSYMCIRKAARSPIFYSFDLTNLSRYSKQAVPFDPDGYR
jgi:hypothetical protein